MYGQAAPFLSRLPNMPFVSRDARTSIKRVDKS